MTEAGWTRDKPTAAGLYWFREAPTKEPHVVKVWGEHGFMRVLEMWRELSEALDDFDGEFKGPITPDSYRQGRVAALGEVERYMAMRLRLAEASLATEILAGNEVKQGRERAAIAELHGMQRHVSDIKEYNAQQAQEGGVGDVHG